METEICDPAICAHGLLDHLRAGCLIALESRQIKGPAQRGTRTGRPRRRPICDLARSAELSRNVAPRYIQNPGCGEEKSTGEADVWGARCCGCWRHI